MGAYFIKTGSVGCIIFLLIDVFECEARTMPSAAGNTKLFEPGTRQSYQLSTSVVQNEPGEEKRKEVGYQIECDVNVGVVWQGEEEKNEKLLEVEVVEPKLLIKSRKAPTPEGFNVHKSQLEKSKNFPFLIHWKSGKIFDMYVDDREERSIVDFKKGIASLFQFQLLDLETKETDASGHCTVTYKSVNPFSFSKTKTDCIPPSGLEVENTSDPLLTPKVTSSRTAIYNLSQDLTHLESVSAVEHHHLTMLIRKEAASSVSSTQFLTLKKKKDKADLLQSRNLDAAVKEFEKGRQLKTLKHNLDLNAIMPKCYKEDCPSLSSLIKENREHLSSSNLGTLKSASAFVRLLSVARESTKEELAKAFRGSKNKEILAQLCDLAGAVQLPQSHEVIMKIINFDAEADFDNSERYLWALATGSHPHESVIKEFNKGCFAINLEILNLFKTTTFDKKLSDTMKPLKFCFNSLHLTEAFTAFFSDILKVSQRPHPNEKLSQTLVLTLASMANKLSKVPGKERTPLLKQISSSILADLELCKDEDCKIKYLRALRNLNCPKTIPALIHHALKGTKRTSVEAMKCLRSFDPSHWSKEVIDAAQQIYFQAGKKFDSSSRTLALDILLESNPRREILQELLLTLAHHDHAYEVKQYLVQRLRQISDKNTQFSKQVDSIKSDFPHLFQNYNTQAQRGLTTAFGRKFASDEYRNGSLETVLEISKGLLKRGMVDVVVEVAGKSTNLFRLGLFAGGLTSFVSSDDEKENSHEEAEDEVATAGMELSVMGSHLRPFVFFTGQGELISHVWSGTASEKTPAYQGLLLVVDHRAFIPLQAGFVAEVEILGGVSFDLSGQIQISLWNKNAHSLVEKNAGITLQGRVRVDTSFIRSKVEFIAGTEVKLNLQSDLNFYGATALCMQLSQPEVVIKQSIHKIESIPGEKHRLRKSKYTRVVVPGRTYALNRKNDEICSSIFSN